MPSKNQVLPQHFRLLRLFGRDRVAQESDEEARLKIWEMLCRGANLPVVSHAEVVAEWKDLVSGDSHDSGLVANGDIDPKYTSVGVTYKRKIVATHTMPTDALIFKLFTIYANAFDSDEEFERGILHIAERAIASNRETRR